MSEFESKYNVDVVEGKRSKIDKRPELMKELGIDPKHPIYLERMSELEMFSHDIQCMFLKVISNEINEFEEEERTNNRREKLGQKIAILREKRQKHKH